MNFIMGVHSIHWAGHKITAYDADFEYKTQYMKHGIPKTGVTALTGREIKVKFLSNTVLQ